MNLIVKVKVKLLFFWIKVNSFRKARYQSMPNIDKFMHKSRNFLP